MGREGRDALWEMTLETLGEGKSRTLSQLCASSYFLPLIINTLAWVSQSDCCCLVFRSHSLLSFYYYSPLFQLTLSLQHVLWVTDLTAIATGCEEWELGLGAIKIICLSQEISLTQEIKSTQDDCKQNVELGRCCSCPHSACCLLGQRGQLTNSKKQWWSSSP